MKIGRLDKRSVIYTVRNIIIPLYLYSFLFHYVWEMLHMPLYLEMSYRGVYSWIACFFPTLGDANIVVIIWFVGFLQFKDVWWFKNGSLLRNLLIIGLGFGITFILELHALKTGRWVYSTLMPVIPFLNVGISPIFQMTILPLVVFYLVNVRANFKT
jgi:Na+-transporting NADH:ubiquinone oxidoreductase subunit NqrB